MSPRLALASATAHIVVGHAKGWKERSIADEALLLGALLGVAYIRLIGHACCRYYSDVVT